MIELYFNPRRLIAVHWNRQEGRILITCGLPREHTIDMGDDYFFEMCEKGLEIKNILENSEKNKINKNNSEK